MVQAQISLVVQVQQLLQELEFFEPERIAVRLETKRDVVFHTEYYDTSHCPSTRRGGKRYISDGRETVLTSEEDCPPQGQFGGGGHGTSHFLGASFVIRRNYGRHPNGCSYDEIAEISVWEETNLSALKDALARERYGASCDWAFHEALTDATKAKAWVAGRYLPVTAVHEAGAYELQPPGGGLPENVNFSGKEGGLGFGPVQALVQKHGLCILDISPKCLEYAKAYSKAKHGLAWLISNFGLKKRTEGDTRILVLLPKGAQKGMEIHLRKLDGALYAHQVCGGMPFGLVKKHQLFERLWNRE